MKEQNDSFVFFRSFVEASEALPDEKAELKFLKMIIRYGIDEVMPEQERSPEYACFLASYKAIDSAKNRRKASQENGKLGGRPPKEPENPEELAGEALEGGYSFIPERMK